MSVVNREVSNAKTRYDEATLVREQMSLVSDQLTLLRHALTEGKATQRDVLGGVELLRLVVDGFYSDSVMRVEGAVTNLELVGITDYASEHK